MAVYRDRDAGRVVTATTSTTTIVEERDSSVGLIAGLIVAIVIVGLIAWTLFNGGIFGDPARGADVGVRPGQGLETNGTQSGGAAGNPAGAR